MTSEAELRELVEAECEGVMQTVLSARQDLREWLDGDAGRDAVAHAEDALRGCVAVLQTVLQASRTAGGAADLGGRARGIVELLSGPYALSLPDGHVLHMNRAAATLLGRDRDDVNRVPMEQRRWMDRKMIQHHLGQTARIGHCTDVIDMRLGPTPDGGSRRMVLRSERLGEEVSGQPVILMTFDPC